MKHHPRIWERPMLLFCFSSAWEPGTGLGLSLLLAPLPGAVGAENGLFPV